MIEPDGSNVRTPAGGLGISGVGLNGLSYGRAEAADVAAPYYYKRLAYSVDRNATGNGAPIATEVAIDGAAGDTFALDFVGVGPRRFVVRSPYNLAKAQIRGLTLKTSSTDPEDDIDALALHRNTDFPAYLSFPPGSAYDPASIYIVKTMGGPPELFASAAQLGLLAGDVIDAFALGSVPFGGPPPTGLNPNVVIWASLAAGSPTRGGADSILQLWPTPGGTVLTANHLNLGPGDEVNALAVLDPFRFFVGDVEVFQGTEMTAFGSGLDVGGSGGAKAAFNLIIDGTNTWGKLVYWALDGSKHTLPVQPVGGLGQIQCDVLGVFGSKVILNIKALAPGGWMLGTEMVETNGTYFCAVDFGAGAASVSWVDHTSPTPTVFTPALDPISKSDGMDHALIAGLAPSEAEGICTIGGMEINKGAMVSRAFCLGTWLGPGGPEDPLGMLFEGLGGGNSSPAQLTAADTFVTPGALPGSSVCWVSCAVSIIAPDLRMWYASPDGLSAPMDLPNINPGGGPATILVTFRIEGNTVTFSHAVPLKVVIGSNPHLEIRDIVMLDGCLFIAVNSGGLFTFGGETYVRPNEADSYLFKLSSENPGVVLYQLRTDSPDGIRTEISAICHNSMTGDIAVPINIIDISAETGPAGPFSFRFYNPANDSAAVFNFTGNLGIGAGACCVNAETGEVGPFIVNALPANLADTYPYIIFTGVVPCGPAFKIGGLSYTTPLTIHPTETSVSTIRSGVQADQHLVFTFDIAPSAVGNQPTIRIEFVSPNQVRIFWTGDELWCSDTLMAPWTTMENAPNPYLHTINGRAKFFQASSPDN